MFQGENFPEEVIKAAADPANVFGKYVLVKSLGRGGQGTVYRAWQRELGRYVAVKFLRSDDPEEITRFAREARLVAKLSHPNIVPIHELGEFQDREGSGPFKHQHYIVMESVDGTTLDEIRLPIRGAIRLMRDAAEAVHYANENGVVHRDLKPSNILVAPDGRCFVTDFGLARLVKGGSSHTQSGIVVGTPAYMSPEQAQGHVRVDGRTDVYGLGATLYELVTYSPPHTGDSPLDIILGIASVEPIKPTKLNPDVPKEVESIILRAMAHEPHLRYATARAMAEDLQRYLDGEVVLARPPSFTYRMSRRFKRNRVASILTIALAVVLLLAPLAFLLQMAVSDHNAKGIKLGESAWQQYLFLNYKEAERIAGETIEEFPGVPISYFCMGRCKLREYLMSRPLPSVWVYEGMIVFDEVRGPSDPNLESLRAEARKLFQKMEEFDSESLHGWESDCARGIEALLDGDYAAAEQLLSSAIATDKADPEVNYYLSQAQYYQGKFAEGSVTIFGSEGTQADQNRVEGLRERGFWPPDVDLASARMSQALGLRRQLRGKDPTEQFERAIVILKSATFLHSETAAAKAILLVNWGRYLMSFGRLVEARAKFIEAVDECANANQADPVILEAHGEALVALADVNDAQGHGQDAVRAYSDAIQSFDQAIEAAQRFPRASAKKGRAFSKLAAYHSRLREDSEARNWSRKGLDAFEIARRELSGQAHLHPDIMIDIILLNGFLQIINETPRRQVIEDAIKKLGEVVDVWPQHARAVLARGIELGRYALALRYTDPLRAEELFMRAKVDFHRSIEINPGWAEAHDQLGRIWMGLGLHRSRAGQDPSFEFMQARKSMNTAVKKNPMECGHLLSRAELWMRMAERAVGQQTNPSIFHWIARAECERATKLNKESAEASHMLGLACLYLGDDYVVNDPVEAGLNYETARRNLDNALETAPENAEAYYHRGNTWFNLAYAVIEDPEEKEQAYKKAIQDYSESLKRSWRETECYFGRGRAYLQVGAYTDGLTDLMDARKRNSTLEFRRKVDPLIEQARKAIQRGHDF